MIQTSSGYYPGGLISGSSTYGTYHYPVKPTGYVYNIFDTASFYWYDNSTPTTTNGNFITGTLSPSFPTYSVSQPGNYQFRAFFDISSIINNNSATGNYEFFITKNDVNIYSTRQSHLGSVALWQYFQFNASSNLTSLSTTDKISFKLKLTDFTTGNFTSSISTGSVYCVPVTSADILYTVTTSSYPFISGSIDSNGDGFADTLILSSDLTAVYGNSIYHPEYTSGSYVSSSLDLKYGSVSLPFLIQANDIFLFKSISPYSGLTQYEYRIKNASSIDGKYYVFLSSNLPSFLNSPTYTTSSFDEVLFLRELPDETQILLKFNKVSGKTSYGLVISDDIHKDVLKNIDNITSQAKTKLLEINNNG